jgi:integrase
MATITKRGKGWYVQVRRKGFPARFATFRSKAEAAAWARTEEKLLASEDANGGHLHVTLGELLARYRDTVSVGKRGAASETARLSNLIETPMSALPVRELRPSHLAAYRDQRLKRVKPGTVRRELTIIRSALETARREWGIELTENPMDKVARPIVRDARDRRLSQDEWRRLEPKLRLMRNKEVEQFIRLALETALRRGELLSLQWRHVDLERRVALVPDTKTGRPRTIPLSPEAVRLLASKEQKGQKVLNLSPTALRHAWERLCARAKIEDLRVHDLRHEALSRFSELGLNTPELATISGHKDVRMLLRYTHVRPAALAARLAALMPDASPLNHRLE